MSLLPRKRVLLLAGFVAFTAAARENDPADFIPGASESFLADDVVSIASGHTQLERTAPAVTSVITAQQIKDTGARDLYDVLRTVPGFFLGQPAIGTQPFIAVRGFTSDFNQNVLVMLDDVPLNEQVFGDRFAMLGRVPLDMVERVEIMRGPGSALYGADAYAAVINVITRRTPPDKTRVTVGGGSQSTRSARLLGGGRLGGADVVGGFEYHETDGGEPWIPADTQTLLDRLFGTRVSLAPGRGNTHQQHVGALVNVTGESLSLMARYSQSRDIGMLTGLAGALDPGGHLDVSVLEAGLGWRAQGRDWLFKAHLNGLFSLYQLHNASYFPPGAFGGAFPEGVRTNVKMEEQRVRFQGKLEYGGWSKHLVSAGFGAESARVDLGHESRNYRIENGQIVPLGRYQDILDPALMAVGSTGFSNDLHYLFLQDEWTFEPLWTLTWGVRYDRYSDFGDIVSPRVALVWDATPELTVKALYGRGFRGPSLIDREARNIPSIKGNPALKPEKLDSFELAFDYRPRDAITARLNLYYQQTEDQIRLQNSGGFEYRPENVGQQKGRGLELEGWWDFDSKTQFYAAYAYQDNTDETTGEDAGFTPHHLAVMRVLRRQTPWQFALQGRYVGVRDRLAEDPLPRADTYGFVDALARYRFSPALEVGLEVRNLFDTRVEDARVGTGFPGDTPLPGRTFYFSLTGFF